MLKISLYLLPAYLMISIATSSQIINVENSRMHSDTTGWMGGAGAAFNLTKNVKQVTGIDLTSHLQYKTKDDKGLWLLLGNYNFLKAGIEKLASQGFGHIRYNRKLNAWLRWEIFGQFQNNIVTQIDSRFLVGTGLRIKIVKTKKLRLYSASLLMFENEKEKTTPVLKHNDLRNSSYITFTYLPLENIELVCTSFFQPLLKKFADYRILNQSALKVKATSRFSLSLKWNYLFDTFPAGDAPKTTYTFATGIDYDF